MARQAKSRYKVTGFLRPIGYVFLMILFTIACAFNIDAFLETNPDERMSSAAGGAVALILFVYFFSIGRAMKDVDRQIDHPDPGDKPLLCSCGKDNSKVYRFPQFTQQGLVVFFGLILASVPALLATHHPDFLIIPIFAIVFSTFVFIGSAAEYIIRGHRWNCSINRGVTFTKYLTHASLLWKYYDVYEDRDPASAKNDPLWLILIQLVVSFLSIFAIVFTSMLVANLIEYLFW